MAGPERADQRRSRQGDAGREQRAVAAGPPGAAEDGQRDGQAGHGRRRDGGHADEQGAEALPPGRLLGGAGEGDRESPGHGAAGEGDGAQQRAGQRRQRRGVDQEHQHQHRDPHGPHIRLAHDLQRLVRGPARAEAIGGVGHAVEVEGTGQPGEGREPQHGAEDGAGQHAGAVEHRRSQGAEQQPQPREARHGARGHPSVHLERRHRDDAEQPECVAHHCHRLAMPATQNQTSSTDWARRMFRRPSSSR